MTPYDQIADLLKEMAHPLRLQILEVLRDEDEACVCHLEARLGQRQAIISQQLARLREAGLVTDRRDGMNVYYSRTDNTLDPLLAAASRVMISQWGKPALFASTPCTCPRCTARALKSTVQGLTAAP
jgi:DNA-binding transcriptional ArsR family regulator